MFLIAFLLHYLFIFFIHHTPVSLSAVFKKKTQSLTCFNINVPAHLCFLVFARLFPTSVYFSIFLLFLSCSLKLLMFSSQTILVPQGNKEADKWIVAKLYFQFLCWFFQTEQLSQDGAQVSGPYMAGGSRTTDSYNSTLYDFFAFNVKFLFGFI